MFNCRVIVGFLDDEGTLLACLKHLILNIVPLYIYPLRQKPLPVHLIFLHFILNLTGLRQRPTLQIRLSNNQPAHIPPPPAPPLRQQLASQPQRIRLFDHARLRRNPITRLRPRDLVPAPVRTLEQPPHQAHAADAPAAAARPGWLDLLLGGEELAPGAGKGALQALARRAFAVDDRRWGWAGAGGAGGEQGETVAVLEFWADGRWSSWLGCVLGFVAVFRLRGFHDVG